MLVHSMFDDFQDKRLLTYSLGGVFVSAASFLEFPMLGEVVKFLAEQCRLLGCV